MKTKEKTKKQSKKTEKLPKVERKYGFLVIDSKYYQTDMLDGKTIFKQVNERTVKNRVKFVDEIVEKLKDSLDKEAVLRESLMKVNKQELETIHNMLYNSKRKYKPITREHHCVDMKIGNLIVPIVD